MHRDACRHGLHSGGHAGAAEVIGSDRDDE